MTTEFETYDYRIRNLATGHYYAGHGDWTDQSEFGSTHTYAGALALIELLEQEFGVVLSPALIEEAE